MVAPLRVPKRYEVGLAKIRDLSDEVFRELLSALRDAPLTFNEDSLSAAVADEAAAIPPNDIEEIVTALLSLYSLRYGSSSPPSEIAERVSLGMEESVTA